MTFGEIVKKMFTKKEPEVYTPQREYIDKRHDALQRQVDFYRKKAEIPQMEARVKQMERKQFGNGFKTPDKNNILKVPNHFRMGNPKFRNRGGMLT